MPGVATSPRKRVVRLGLPSEKGSEIVGVVLAALVLLLAGSLASFHPEDASFLHRTLDGPPRVRNLIGPVGAEVAALSFALLGLASLLLPLLLAAVAWRQLVRRDGPAVRGRGVGLLGVLLALPGVLQLLVGEVSWRGAAMPSGGAFGVLTAEVLTSRLNVGGAFVVLAAILLVGGSLAVDSSLRDLLESGRRHLLVLADRLRLRWTQRRERRQKERMRRRVITRHLARASAEREAEAAPAPVAPERLDLPLRVTEKPGEGHFSVRRVRPAKEVAAPPAGQEQLEFGTAAAPAAELPPVNLLDLTGSGQPPEEGELIRRGETIRRSCAEFGVEGSIEGISPGPVITVYELQPAPGVKVSRIVNLQDDLALALKAESVRIDRIPGRSTLGIEVPNHGRQVIRLGRLLDSDAFRAAPSVLTLALGVDIHGRPYIADLATMPHLLVAGATGAGKSVGLQSMITSILYKATREQVQFIFIDPKRIELGVYADVPHLKAEVVVEPKKAANALRWAVGEMERRYRLLAEVHVRSIEYYNRAIRDPQERKRLALKEGEGELDPGELKPLPYYVIIIDELADLMMVSSSEVETAIARLAQMARAVGIHLIVATQRPSVDILTGTIKANFPCRLAYATATRHDSRTILDTVGSEKLLGNGDALFMPPGTSRMVRLHGAYISEQETAALVRWLKRRGKPELDPEVVRAPDDGRDGGGAGGDGDDELFDEAARLVVAERQASASFLQRRLRVGFSRAARLIDMMEADGLLGPAQGSKPRQVLVKPGYFDEIDAARREEG